MKIFKSVLALSVLLTMLVACGGDSSSSSVSPDPRPCEDQNEDCDDTSSSSGEVSKNSSSSQKSTDKGKSSSSEKNAKESSSSVKPTSSDGKQSSSSTKKDGSSSSVVKSSSSVVPSSSGDLQSSSSKKDESSSSVNSSGSAKSSSSAKAVMGGPCPKDGVQKIIGGEYAECVNGVWTLYIPPSSSSTPKSSSSQGYKSLPNPLRYNMSYGEFTDSRDGTKYATIDIDNEYGPDSVHLAFTVFAQNLKYHEKMVAGTEEQEDDTKVEMYCYNDSIEYCNDWWGGLYQWAEMMALPYECNSKSCADLIDPDGNGFHQGICPSGWHVMTERELLAASYTSGGDKYLDNRMSSLASEISYSLKFGINTSGMSFIAAGYRDGEENAFAYLKESAVVDYPEESPSEVVSTIAGGVSKYMTLLMGNLKTSGVSVRCVKDY
ncbi:FISUMP domain-containing protein [Fibrobacter sp.]|uniref:FISUMP domain-containing protein n=1 Tax=Fibrobacter sp. TaxID=35828 RepID=UPI0038907659